MFVSTTHYEDVEFEAFAPSRDFHGHVGSWDEAPPDESRPIGFRLPHLDAKRFPRGPAYSTDGRTWIECDLRDEPA